MLPPAQEIDPVVPFSPPLTMNAFQEAGVVGMSPHKITSPPPYPQTLADIPNTQCSPSPDPGYIEKLNNRALMDMACPDKDADLELFDTTSKHCF